VDGVNVALVNASPALQLSEQRECEYKKKEKTRTMEDARLLGQVDKSPWWFAFSEKAPWNLHSMATAINAPRRGAKNIRGVSAAAEATSCRKRFIF